MFHALHLFVFELYGKWISFATFLSLVNGLCVCYIKCKSAKFHFPILLKTMSEREKHPNHESNWVARLLESLVYEKPIWPRLCKYAVPIENGLSWV